LGSGGFSVRDGEAERVAERLEERFGVHSADFVVAYRHPVWAVDDARFQAELRAVVSSLRTLPTVHDVRAPVLPPGTSRAAVPTPLRSKDGRIGLLVVTVTGQEDETKLAHHEGIEAAVRDT